MVEYLPAEIANEGQKAGAIVTDNNDGSGDYQPPMDLPHVPDYKGIKSIAKYFPQYSNRPYVHKPFPAWVYHMTKEPMLIHDKINSEGRVIKTAAEWAAELGLTWEGPPRMRWNVSGEWNPEPVAAPKSKTAGTGKVLVEAVKTIASQASDNIATIIAAVMAAMGKAEKPGTNALAADPDYAAFLAFKEFQKQAGAPPAAQPVETQAQGSVLSAEDEKAVLIDAASERGVKIDKRWSVERLKEELDKVA